VAWTSLLAGLAMMSTGCLVTSVPDYSDPKQTPPFLVAAAASPNVWEPLEIFKDPNNLEYPSQPFQLAVRSEDAGKKVQFKRFIDYGSGSSPEQPYFTDESAGELPPGHLADGDRTFTKNWTPRNIPTGCHTLTLIASHAFDSSTDCPVDLADSSQLTWQILLCPEAQSCTRACDPGDTMDTPPKCDIFSMCDDLKDWTMTCPATTAASTTVGSP